MALAHLALTLLTTLPQGSEEIQDPRLTTALTKAEHKKLNGLAQKWFTAIKKWDDEVDPRKRGRLVKTRDRARDKFMKEWRAKEKKEPLKHVGDLLAVFSNVFPYDKQSGTGEIKPVKGDAPFDVVVPRGYKKELNYTTVTLLPDVGEDGSWEDNKRHFAATWKGVDAAKQWLFVMPRSSSGVELDLLPDLSMSSGDSVETTRIKEILFPLGTAQKMYRFNRNKLILDCGKGASGFGMRLASYFPTRFAGLILRHPVGFGVAPDGDDTLSDSFRYESLSNLRVALVTNPDNSERAATVAKRLNEHRAGCASLFEESDAELQDKLAAWVDETNRELFREQVVLAPNHDRFKKGYWIQLDTAESVHSGPDGRPYLKAEADRDANRITVTAKNVGSFQLLLNDALLDLDREFTIVVNGTAITEKRQRSFSTMMDFLSFNLFDPNRVWTTTYSTSVPKAADGGTGNGAK